MNSSIGLPVSSLDDEQVTLRSRSRYLFTTPTGWGYSPIQGDLWLTNQRVIFMPDAAVSRAQRVALGAADAAVVWFPIKRVTECCEQPMRVQWGNPNVLRLQFDNGGREYFELQTNARASAGAWAAAITKARADATELSYDAVPALKPGFEQPAGKGAQGMLLYVLLGSMVL